MVSKIGLDLGYANIAVSDATAEVYREPSVALIDPDTRRIISVGSNVATANVGDAKPVRPFKNGLLYSSDLTKNIIAHVISSIKREDKLRCVVGVPSDFLPKQEQEIFDMLHEAGVDEAFAVTRPFAALVGAGYAPTASAISVNVGASYTEIAIVHNGVVIHSAREKIGGEDFDLAVKKYILEQGDMKVTLIVARTIKERLGAVWQGRPNESIDIDGTLSLTGSKIRISISTEDIVGVFQEPLRQLILAIGTAIKKIDYAYVADIFKTGIVLSGGGAELFGLDKMIEKVLGIAVTVPGNPIDCVAKGLARINSLIPARTKSDKNITSQVAKLYDSKNSKKKR